VVLWLVLPIAFAAAVSVVRPMLVERYLAVCLPASMLLAARGVAALASWTRAAAIALLLLMVFNSASAIGFYYRHPEYDENWRAAILHVLDNVQPGDEIVIDPYSRFTFDFYSGQRGFRSSALNFSGDLTSAVAHDPAPSQIWLVARKNSQSQVDEFLRRQHRYCQPVEPFLTYDLRAWRFIPCESK
jgi:hypothetical protein